jgi:beta-glucosidase-like glycosyl hydrolase
VGVSATLKHFAANNQEFKRQNGDSILDERSLREIYLTPFEIAVKEGKPDAVMSAYNKINGIHASDDKRLLTDILRNEWGFDGVVVTDWGGLSDRVEAFRAGCDLNMPGGSSYMETEAYNAVISGELDEKYVDESAARIIALSKKHENEADPMVVVESIYIEIKEFITIYHNIFSSPLAIKTFGILGPKYHKFVENKVAEPIYRSCVLAEFENPEFLSLF